MDPFDDENVYSDPFDDTFEINKRLHVSANNLFGKKPPPLPPRPQSVQKLFTEYSDSENSYSSPQLESFLTSKYELSKETCQVPDSSCVFRALPLPEYAQHLDLFLKGKHFRLAFSGFCAVTSSSQSVLKLLFRFVFGACTLWKTNSLFL